MFQHTATRRWLPIASYVSKAKKDVSTHSHPKVAALLKQENYALAEVSTHSHPKVAARVYS